MEFSSRDFGAGRVVECEELLPVVRYMVKRVRRRCEGIWPVLRWRVDASEYWSAGLTGGWRAAEYLSGRVLESGSAWSVSYSIVSREILNYLRECGYVPNKPGRK